MSTPTRNVPACSEDGHLRHPEVPTPPRGKSLATTLAIWVPLLLVPSVVTVVRYSAAHLIADGVQQSVMSIQGPELFYWGQDRLFPAISWLASPIADPTANLWACLVLQAISLHGLLLYVAAKSAGVLDHETGAAYGRRRTTVLTYLVLVATINALWDPAMMQSLATEGQPYALSWLLTALAYEAWRRESWSGWAVAATLAFVALGINPSVVLLAAFLAAVQVLRTRRVLTWLLFLGVLGVVFVMWSFLSEHFAMYATPEQVPGESYLSFSLDIFGAGFPTSIAHVIEQHRPLRTAVCVLAALAALLVVGPALRDRLVLLGSYFAGFTVLYVALFAGNRWVEMNGFNFRYFFPLQVLIVLLIAMPVTGAVLVLAARIRGRDGISARIPAGAPVTLALVGVVLAFLGPLQLPQNAPVLTRDDATESFARTNDIRFISGNYWYMWPLMHGLLEDGRDAVFVAGYKAHGDRSQYQRTLESQMSENGRARAVCVNDSVVACQTYLDYWTEPGWQPVRGGGATCPTTPQPDPNSPPATCRVLTFKP